MEKVKETVLNAGYALQRFDPRSGRILVIDGNGVIGYRVAARLLSAGYPTVRVGCADNELADVAPLVSKGAEVKEFVWSKDYTYAQALQDVKSVYVAFPADSNMEERYPKFIAACKKAGVKHIVQLSFIHAVQEGTTGTYKRRPLECIASLVGRAFASATKTMLTYEFIFASSTQQCETLQQ